MLTFSEEGTMAQGIFGRIRNLWRGFLSLFVSGMETRNPRAVYEAAIEQRRKQFESLKKSVASVMLLRDRLDKRLSEKRRELDVARQELDAAVDGGDDDVALSLIEKKDRLSDEIAELKSDLDKATMETEEAKKSLVSFRDSIEQLKVEKERMLALKATAEARITIQEQLEGLSADADIRALEGVRDHIQKLRAQADISRELKESDLEKRLLKIREATGASSARRQLEELKKQRAAGASRAAKSGTKVQKKL